METIQTGRREEYSRVATGIARIAKDFGLEITEEEKADVHLIVRLSEIIDRIYDAIGDASEREAFAEKIIRSIREGEELKEHGEELENSLEELKSLFKRHPRIKETFLQKVSEIFELGELIRVTKEVREGIKRIQEEGRLIAEIYLLPLENVTEGPFTEFIVSAGAVANVIDDLLDARADVQSGERSYDLNLNFYREMLKTSLSGLFELCRKYPNKRLALHCLPRAIKASKNAQRPAIVES